MLDQSGDKTQPSLPDPPQTEHKESGEEFLSTCDVLKNPEENMPTSGEEENFSSPIQVTPLFRSLADGIPSPQFSESVSLTHTHSSFKEYVGYDQTF